MKKRLPRIRLLGDKALATTYIRLAKGELFRTKQLALRVKVETYGRTYRPNDNLIIRTNVSPAGDTIEIYAVPLVPTGDEIPELEIEEPLFCPPGILVQQRKYLSSLNNPDAPLQYHFPSLFNIEKSKWVSRRDDLGILLTPTANGRWVKGNIDDIFDNPDGNTYEAFNGGWWGLKEAVLDGSLYGTYKSCDLVSWGGVASNFAEIGTFLPYLYATSQLAYSGANWSGGFATRRTKNYFCYAGKKYRVFKSSTATMPSAAPYDILGVCIISDPITKKDYFHAIIEQFIGSDNNNDIIDIFTNTPNAGDTMHIVRQQVNQTLTAGMNFLDDWEYVGGVSYTDVGGENLGVSLNKDHFEPPLTTAHIDASGTAYILRQIRRNHVTYGTIGYNVLVQIDLSDASFSIVDSSDAPAKPGYIIAMFGGLDKLYTYRIVHSNVTTPDLPVTSEPYTASQTSQIVCYEDGTEIDRITIVNQNLSISEASVAGPFLQRQIVFHHPKIPGNWFYVEKNITYLGSSATITYSVYENNETTSTRSSAVDIPEVTEAGEIPQQGSEEAHTTLQLSTAMGRYPPVSTSHWTVEFTPTWVWGTILYTHNVGLRHPDSYYDNLGANYVPGSEFLHPIASWAAAAFSVQMAQREISGNDFRPVYNSYTAVHRPAGKATDWSYVVVLPRIRLYPATIKPFGSMTRPDPAIQNRAREWNSHLIMQLPTFYRDTPVASPTKTYYGFDQHRYWADLWAWDDTVPFTLPPTPHISPILFPLGPAYFQPLGWETNVAKTTGKGYPPGEGVYDVKVYSNILTADEIKKIIKVDEAFIGGLGII